MTLQSLGHASPREIAELAPWFHNLHLPGGLETAPDHPLGDFPAFKWLQLEPALPRDLVGWRALDIGCNAGFYTFELAKRGAQVTGLEIDSHYLEQALDRARHAVEREQRVAQVVEDAHEEDDLEGPLDVDEVVDRALAELDASAGVEELGRPAPLLQIVLV